MDAQIDNQGVLIVAFVVLATLAIMVGFAMYSRHKRVVANDRLAEQMLDTNRGGTFVEMKELYKTIAAGREVDAPAHFLCRSLCAVLALSSNKYEGGRLINARLEEAKRTVETELGNKQRSGGKKWEVLPGIWIAVEYDLIEHYFDLRLKGSSTAFRQNMHNMDDCKPI